MSYCENTIKKMLPKTYLRKHVAHEIYVAKTCFKNIEPMMDKYVYNDGTKKDLMSLTGTLPVMFDGNLHFVILFNSEVHSSQFKGECDLVTLLQVMQFMFGDFPPVWMQPRSEPERASCQQQFHRQPEVLAKRDGSSYLSVPRDDGQPFLQEHETNC
ncbi:hypothetical protein F2P81_007220 [Scophthalmus maximus]|uniref:UEV domain-containing protein n=1 Tax=Scophthalmus maximus TaxID=52904 RepID=A0A6A4TGS8_SCOMX|nr:hypothetical protein F2P81_007220 [Scophthalmus maximus]